jgi:hypothetical protein
LLFFTIIHLYMIDGCSFCKHAFNVNLIYYIV